MKLVDILARELKEWPQGARWILHDGANGCYADLGITSIDVGIDCSEFDGNPSNAVFEGGWQAAVDALKADEYHEPDNGVEAWLHGVDRDYGNDAAQKCRAIINEARLKLERSKACDAIYGVLTGPTVERKGNTSDMAEALYDAGYRKFEIVES